MPATYLSLFYHLVFSTKRRYPYIKELWESRLHSYISGIIRGLDGEASAVGGDSDHMHILSRLKATHCLAEFVRDIKANSSGWIHRVIGSSLFEWQGGYAAFTVSRSDVETTRQYILRQKEHHRKQSFQEEYLHLLKQSGVEFDERFLW